MSLKARGPSCRPSHRSRSSRRWTTSVSASGPFVAAASSSGASGRLWSSLIFGEASGQRDQRQGGSPPGRERLRGVDEQAGETQCLTGSDVVFVVVDE